MKMTYAEYLETCVTPLALDPRERRWMMLEFKRHMTRHNKVRREDVARAWDDADDATLAEWVQILKMERLIEEDAKGARSWK